MFGTDGWRAIVGDEFTYNNVAICARALGLMLKEDTSVNSVCIGYDTRFCSDKFAYTAAEALAKMGISVWLFSQPAPTPACSFSVVNGSHSAGIMITASHNSYEWNGFKLRTNMGSSAPVATVERIQLLMNLVIEEKSNSSENANIVRFNPLPAYINSVTSLLQMETIKDSNLNLIVDSMHGAGSGILKKILSTGKISVKEVRSEVNPSFPCMKQPEPIAVNLKPLITAVKESNADLGLALDGDADRLGVVDKDGTYISTLHVFPILLYHLVKNKGMRGAVACTLTMSVMVDRICEKFGLTVYRTPVGFKHIAPLMISENCIIGGEESGGYAFKTHIPERDGILSALTLIEAVVMSGKNVSGLLEEVEEITGKYYFHREDLTLPASQSSIVRNALSTIMPTNISGINVIHIDRIDGVRFDMGKYGWVAARISATEPLLRIYTETVSREVAKTVVAHLKQLIFKESNMLGK